MSKNCSIIMLVFFSYKIPIMTLDSESTLQDSHSALSKFIHSSPHTLKEEYIKMQPWAHREVKKMHMSCSISALAFSLRESE
jgi:hypothetical protein